MAIVTNIFQMICGPIGKGFGEQGEKMFCLKGLVGHSPNGQSWFLRKGLHSDVIRGFELMSTLRETFRPANRA